MRVEDRMSADLSASDILILVTAGRKGAERYEEEQCIIKLCC